MFLVLNRIKCIQIVVLGERAQRPKYIGRITKLDEGDTKSGFRVLTSSRHGSKRLLLG